MTILAQITARLTKSLKEKDKVATSTLRFLIAGLHNVKIAKGEDLTDEEIVSEIVKEVKRHKESIEAFKKGNRQDLVEKERKELVILESYLPKQLSADEIAKVVDGEIAASGASASEDIGRIIGQVMAKVKGQADGAVVAQMVRERLSN